jgi:hypothetical protein
MGYKEHGLSSYPEYLKTSHWHQLKQKYLWKKDAVCYICNTWSRLLLHHITYDNLFSEKPFRDFYILCPDCHTKCHFWTQNMFKVPLAKGWLLLSLRMRKLGFFVHNRQFGLVLLWFLFLLFSSASTLLFYLLERVLLFGLKMSWEVVKYFLSILFVDIE